MRFSRDRRGQSVVVGTVILFGFLILALSLYQVQIVPQENSEIEFDHSQEVENDFLDLRNDVLSAGTTGFTRSTSIRLGPRYPQRTFFLNPPAPSGTLQTTDKRPLEIRNATVKIDDGAHENVRYFWENGTERGTYGPEFDTRSIRYRPNYNEYQGAPELVYENSLVAAEFGDRVLPRSDQTIVREERVSLTALSGEISENGVEARSVDSEAVSRGSRTIPISGDGSGGDLEIVLPTDTSNPSDLVQRLDVPANVTASDDQIAISLNSSETYRLGLSEVSVDGSGSTAPAYIVPVGGQSVTSGQSVGVEVRDKYNNPVEGADVTIDRDGINTDDDRTTDDDGRVFFDPGTNGATASINGGTVEYEDVEFTVNETGSAGPSEYDVNWDDSEMTLDLDTPELASGTVFANQQPLDDATVDFATTDPSVVEVASTSTRTDQGDFSETLEPRGVGEATVFAASGDDVSSIDITVTDPPGTPSSPVNFVATDVVEDGNLQEFVFTVDGLGTGDQATIDLSGPQSDGIDYTNGVVELIEETNPNDVVTYDPNTNTITYTKQGGSSGEVRIRISDINVIGSAGDSYNVEYADDDGNVDSDTFQIRPSGTTIVTQDTDDVSANGDIVIEENVVIDGDVDSENGAVTVKDSAEVDGDVTANGDIVIGDNTFVGGEVASQNGAVTVGDNAEVDDDVSANGNIVVDDDTFIDGDVDSQNGTVSLGSGTRVTGTITANGDIDLGVGSVVEGDVTSQNGRVTLEDDSEVEGDVNVNSASDIVCGQGSRIDGQPCEEYVAENY